MAYFAVQMTTTDKSENEPRQVQKKQSQPFEDIWSCQV